MRTCPLNTSLFLSRLRLIWMVGEALDVGGGDSDRPASYQEHPPPIKSRCLIRVNLVVLTVGRSLPVYPDKQTFSACVGMSQTCHCTKSLRSSPLRGGKSREVGSQSRGQRWSNGELALRMEMSANVTQDRAPYEQRSATLHSQSAGSAHNRGLTCAATFRRSETISSACSKARLDRQHRRCGEHRNGIERDRNSFAPCFFDAQT